MSHAARIREYIFNMKIYTIYFWHSNRMFHERVFRVILLSKIMVTFNIIYWINLKNKHSVWPLSELLGMKQRESFDSIVSLFYNDKEYPIDRKYDTNLSLWPFQRPLVSGKCRSKQALIIPFLIKSYARNYTSVLFLKI